MMARGWLTGLAAVLVTAFAVAHLADDRAVTLLAAGGAFAATVLIGRRADRDVREQLRRPSRGR